MIEANNAGCVWLSVDTRLSRFIAAGGIYSTRATGDGCWLALLLAVLVAQTSLRAQSTNESLPTVGILVSRNASEAGLLPGAFLITRTGPLDRPLTVEYQISGTASNGWDYQWLPGQVTIPAGQEAVQVMVQPYDHELDEPPETVVLTLVPRNRPFTVAILPDTQCYTGELLGGTPEMLTAQTQWIVSQQNALNLKFVLHEGDCTQNNALLEWQRFRASMNVLDGRVPYVVAVGNHDGLYSSVSYTAYFNQFFNVTNYLGRPDFGGVFETGRMDNCYHLFTAGGVDWLVLSLEFGPRDTALAWANQVVSNYPDRKVILLTHTHIYADNTLHGSLPTHLWTPYSYGRANNGTDVWQKFLRPHTNTAFAFNGHVLLNGTGRLVSTNAGGNRVYQMLANYQERPLGGGGYLRLARFFPEADRLSISTYSPYLDAWLTDAENQFEYTNLGVFPKTSPGYVMAPNQGSASLILTNNDHSTYPPQMVAVASMGLPPVFAVAFDIPVETASAEALTNYSLGGGARLLSARLADDQRTVYLTADSNLVDGTSCVLTVNHVRNLARGTAMTNAAQFRFIYRALLMTDPFTQGDLAGWTVVDEAVGPGTSLWVEGHGCLFQLSNLFGPNNTAVDHRLGTYVYWHDPLARAWTDYALTVTFKNADDDGVGVLFRYQNPSNYYKFELDAQRSFRKLFKMVDGVETTLAQETGGYVPGRDHTLRVLVVGNELVMRLNGVMMFDQPILDASLGAGTVALYAWGSQGLAFSNLTVSPASFAPRLVITAPSQGTQFSRSNTIAISVAASDPDGYLVSLEILDETNRLCAFSKPPYDFEWNDAPSGGHTLYARATDNSGLISYSRPVFIRMGQANPPPLVVLQPQNRSVRVGSGVVFTTQAVGAGQVTYQWYYNGQPIAGATNRLFFLNGVNPGNVGGYWVTARNQNGADASQVTVLTVNDAPDATGIISTNFPRLSILALNEAQAPLLALEAAPAVTVTVQTSSSLTNWQTLLSLTNLSGTYYFMDPAAAADVRFYRAITIP